MKNVSIKNVGIKNISIKNVSINFVCIKFASIKNITDPFHHSQQLHGHCASVVIDYADKTRCGVDLVNDYADMVSA